MNKTAILCVDDEEIVLSSLKRQLRRHFGNEHTIEVAQDGEEALEIVEELTDSQIELAVIISDYIMPGMKGDELLRRIHEMMPDTVTILLTGQANTDGVTNAVNNAKLYRYIAKPWDQTDLILTVTEALRSYKQDRMLEEHNTALQQVNQQLEQLNANLESQVAARTEELQQAYHNLKKLHERMEDDLALAREIQRGLLPPPRIQWPGLDVVCHSAPASEVGGDFYLYYSFDDSRFAVMVSDVAGKGVSAALLMASSLAHIDASLQQNFTPPERLAYLDIAISPYTKARRQNCALCYVEIEKLPNRSYTAHIVNAACIPPFIRRAAGGVEWPDVRGFALGLGLGATSGYQQISVNLSRNDLIILVSDGVVEARNADGEMYGFERLEASIASGPTISAIQMMAHIVFDVTRFMGNTEPDDDLTIQVTHVV